MKNAIQKILLSSFFLFFFNLVIFVLQASAQPGMPVKPQQTPLGGGWLIGLAGVGGYYGIKKLRERNKES